MQVLKTFASRHLYSRRMCSTKTEKETQRKEDTRDRRQETQHEEGGRSPLEEGEG